MVNGSQGSSITDMESAKKRLDDYIEGTGVSKSDIQYSASTEVAVLNPKGGGVRQRMYWDFVLVRPYGTYRVFYDGQVEQQVR